MEAGNRTNDTPKEPVVSYHHTTTTEATLTECQIDGSWLAYDSLRGHEWIVMEGDISLLLGLRTSRRGLSPLHTRIRIPSLGHGMPHHGLKDNHWLCLRLF